jgi:PBSX family phage terminase large subunit
MVKGLRVYIPAKRTRKRYRFIYGGAGSAKSVFVAQDILELIRANPQFRVLVVRKTKTSLRHSTFALFVDIISDLRWNFATVNKTDMTITCPGGGSIVHAGLDDVDKLKSIAGITHIWIEEATEITIQDMGQLDLRLRHGNDLQMTLTFNPTFEANRLFDYIGYPVADLPERSFVETENAYIQHTTYLDNRHIGDEYMEVFKRLSAISDSFRDIYMLGKLAVTDEPDQLIKWQWVKTAFQRERADAWTDGRQRAGVDVGRYGDDPSVFVHLAGYSMVDMWKIDRASTTDQGKQFASYALEHAIPAELMGVDGVGLGSGVIDTLYDQGVECTEIIAGGSPLELYDVESTDVETVNIRGQMWWHVRRLFERGLVSLKCDVDPEMKRLLQEDLLAPRYRYKSERVVEVEPKESKSRTWGLRQRLGRSPDYGDALVMGLFVDRYIINDTDDVYSEPETEGEFEYDEFPDDGDAVAW